MKCRVSIITLAFGIVVAIIDHGGWDEYIYLCRPFR